MFKVCIYFASCMVARINLLIERQRRHRPPSLPCSRHQGRHWTAASEGCRNAAWTRAPPRRWLRLPWWHELPCQCCSTAVWYERGHFSWSHPAAASRSLLRGCHRRACRYSRLSRWRWCCCSYSCHALQGSVWCCEDWYRVCDGQLHSRRGGGRAQEARSGQSGPADPTEGIAGGRHLHATGKCRSDVCL